MQLLNPTKLTTWLVFSISLLLNSAMIASAEGVFSETLTLVPRVGNGEGTLSPYGGVTPEFVATGKEGQPHINIPPTNKNQVDVVWTFWNHKQPKIDQWPTGKAARLQVTVTSADGVSFTPILHVLSGNWTEPVSGEKISLSPGVPTTLNLPLPDTLSGENIERIRLTLQGSNGTPQLTISKLGVGNLVPIALDPIKTHIHPSPDEPFQISGRTVPGVECHVEAHAPESGQVKEWKTRADNDGYFTIQARQNNFPLGPLTIRAATRLPSSNTTEWSPDASHYIFPHLSPGFKLPSIERDGRYLTENGEPWAFLGLNYTRFLLEFSLRTNYQHVAEEIRQYGEWGIRVIRIPLHLGMFQPRPGVFPDSPEYAEILKSHKLDPKFFDLFEYCVAVAGHHGIRVVLDWHEMPTDPYRYFVGGNETEKKAGEPGKGIAWLYNKETGEAAVPGDARFDQAIVETNRWLARHFKGNGNILGFEVPYNEPHNLTDSADLAWRRLAAKTILPIVTEDPDRLTFGMPPAWGHSNVLQSTTWLLPDYITGMAPHHYIGNGPIPYRPDAKERHSPWLAREVGPTFDHSFYSISLPTSAAPYPIWNGESGEHGYSSFLPDMPREEATSLMIEAQIVQAYAAGWAGNLGWTLTGHHTVYDPVVEIYEELYRRFTPVFAAGPLDQGDADVLFVQNPAAVPVQNGLNHAAVPFARLALDLHLAPIHYMTDTQLLATGLVQMAVGLEQVEQMNGGLAYKAAVVDTRNLDSRAVDLLKSSKIPLLVVDNAAELSPEQLSEFLKDAGIPLDEHTPSELQIIEGPEHLLVYRRSGEGPTKAYPQLKINPPFKLINESGETVFSGNSSELAQQGISLDLVKWRTEILHIQTQR